MDDPAVLTDPITNIVFDPAGDEAKAWIGEATAKIGDWRAFSRSAYIRWALIINAAHVSEDYYAKLPEDRALEVRVARGDDGRLFQTPFKTWKGKTAASAYREIIPTIAGYGVTDLYGVLEEIVFDAYEILLRHSPRALMEGQEFRDLRRLYARRALSEADGQAWATAWPERFDRWRRKRAYDPLHRVFVAFFNEAGLRRPSYFEKTDVGDWAASIETIAELRHLLTHGEGLVNERLEQLCDRAPMGWLFKSGDELKVDLTHLQAVEYFTEQLLTALNASLCEKGWGRSIKKDLERMKA
jgi:transposase